MPQSEMIAPGSVWLVGAGPGDPDLLTRKAERLLHAADIVFYDALVGQGVLDLITAGVRLVSVGKRSGRHSRPQGSINDLLLDAARTGQRVVRLKGGDPSIFGRSAEEMTHLRAHGVPVFVCPGITAASATAATAGVSLTLRGEARQLIYVTAHARAGEELDVDWSLLADAESTLAIYMGRCAAPAIAEGLMAAGRSGDTPALVASEVSTPHERLMPCTLETLAFTVDAMSEDAPTLLLVGEAVAMRSCTNSHTSRAYHPALPT